MACSPQASRVHPEPAVEEPVLSEYQRLLLAHTSAEIENLVRDQTGEEVESLVAALCSLTW